MCASEEDETGSVCTRERDGYEICVTPKEPTCACGCLKDKERRKEETACKCVDPNLLCYVDHYAGKCGCTCGDCTDCDCEWVVLGRLDYDMDDIKKEKVWKVQLLVRRFVRPVLIRDPAEEPPPKVVKPGFMPAKEYVPAMKTTVKAARKGAAGRGRKATALRRAVVAAAPAGAALTTPPPDEDE
jgi:hypothetical protein